MRALAARLATVAALAALVCASRADAQGMPDKAAAEALFQEGHVLLRQNKLEEACAKLAESLRLDVGLGTMLYLAECYERSGKTASAWEQFREAQAMAAKDKDPREKVARDRADRLEPRLTKLALVVAPEADHAELTITRDGTPIGRAAWGAVAPIDPGTHVIRATAPGHEPWSKTVAIRSDYTGTVRVIIGPLIGLEPAGAPAPPPSASTDAPATTGGLGTQRIAALGVGGLGLLGIGIGTAFGIAAIGTLDDADRFCRGDRCNQEGIDKTAQARSESDASTAAFIAGGVLLAGGVVLWFTAPPAHTAGSSRSLDVRTLGLPGGAGLVLRATLD